MLDKIFWKSFLSKSENFKKPICINNVFTPEISTLKELYFDSFKMMTTQEVSPYGIWLDGGNRNELKGLISEAIVKPEFENLDSFCTNFFEGYSFGVVAHHTNAYNCELGKKFYSYLHPLYEEFGVGFKGVDLNVFMGNYGWTPFGIHQDGPGENVIHFHLGPGVKKMYLWKPENYATIENDAFEDKISKSDFVFEINAGDMFFMPEGYFHIGYTPEYSTGITSWFCSPPVKEFREKIIHNLFNHNLKEDFNTSNNFDLSITKESVIQEKFDHNFKNISESFYGSLKLEDAIHLKIKQHVYALKSSLYYTWPMLLLNDESAKEDLTDDNIIELNLPFIIEYFAEDQINKIFIYSGGHELVLNTNDSKSIILFLETLNSGEKLRVGDHKDSAGEFSKVMNFLNRSNGLILVK